MIFTIASRNYSAHARVLMESVAFYTPQAMRIVVATDGPWSGFAPEGCLMLEAATLSGVTDEMALYYDALEYNTAVKPFAFRHLLDKYGVGVVYLDPDVRLYGPIPEVLEALETHDLVLTPHLIAPLPTPGRPSNLDILNSGTWNLGFCGMRSSPAMKALADWWGEMCRFDCRVAFGEGLFTDQRWMDLALGMAPSAALLRHPGLNVAYWNLPHRPVSRNQREWTAAGAPLRFFHFSGFDPLRPDLLSRHQNRISFSTKSNLGRLLKDYAEALLEAGYLQSRSLNYANQGAAVSPDRRSHLRAACRRGEVESGRAWLAGSDPYAINNEASAEAMTLRSRLAWRLSRGLPVNDADLPDTAAELLNLARFAGRLAGAPSACKETPEAFTVWLGLGLSYRRVWPYRLRAALEGAITDMAQECGKPAGVSPAAFLLWRSRYDMQVAFDLSKTREKLKLTRWMGKVGVREYDLALNRLTFQEQLASIV